MKRSNVKVTARECRGNHERMIRRFIKKTKKQKIIEAVRDRRYYKNPTDRDWETFFHDYRDTLLQ